MLHLFSRQKDAVHDTSRLLGIFPEADLDQGEFLLGGIPGHSHVQDVLEEDRREEGAITRDLVLEPFVEVIQDLVVAEQGGGVAGIRGAFRWGRGKLEGAGKAVENRRLVFSQALAVDLLGVQSVCLQRADFPNSLPLKVLRRVLSRAYSA